MIYLPPIELCSMNAELLVVPKVLSWSELEPSVIKLPFCGTNFHFQFGGGGEGADSHLI